MAIGAEDLDAVVVGVCDVEPASLVDHHAAGLSKLTDLPPFLAKGDGRSVGARFNRGQRGTGDQEDQGDEAKERTNGTSTTEASHRFIHRRASRWVQRSDYR